MDWDSQYFVDLNATKIQLVFFDGSNKLVLLMWRWIGLSLKKNNLSCWDRHFPLKWIGAHIFSTAKTASNETKALIFLWNFFLPRFLFISINAPYNLAWNTVFIFVLVLPDATWIFEISYINRYVVALIQYFCVYWSQDFNTHSEVKTHREM